MNDNKKNNIKKILQIILNVFCYIVTFITILAFILYGVGCTNSSVNSNIKKLQPRYAIHTSNEIVQRIGNNYSPYLYGGRYLDLKSFDNNYTLRDFTQNFIKLLGDSNKLEYSYEYEGFYNDNFYAYNTDDEEYTAYNQMYFVFSVEGSTLSTRGIYVDILLEFTRQIDTGGGFAYDTDSYEIEYNVNKNGTYVYSPKLNNVDLFNICFMFDFGDFNLYKYFTDDDNSITDDSYIANYIFTLLFLDNINYVSNLSYNFDLDNYNYNLGFNWVTSPESLGFTGNNRILEIGNIFANINGRLYYKAFIEYKDVKPTDNYYDTAENQYSAYLLNNGCVAYRLYLQGYYLGRSINLTIATRSTFVHGEKTLFYNSGKILDLKYSSIDFYVLGNENNLLNFFRGYKAIGNESIYLDTLNIYRDAFSSLSSIFNISVLPSLSVGALLFMPLSVAIILAILKLITR